MARILLAAELLLEHISLLLLPEQAVRERTLLIILN